MARSSHSRPRRPAADAFTARPPGAPVRHTVGGPGALVRLLRLHALLVEGCEVTARRAAADLSVTPRTVKRDLAIMRDRLGCPLAWDASRRSYHYTAPCDILPLLRLSADEALSLALAGRAFAAWGGSPLGRALTAALGKIAGVVGGAVSLPADAVSDLVFQPEENSAADAERRCFALALEAIHRRRELRLTYQKPQPTAAPELRLVHPLHLAFLEHEWLLIAFDVVRRAPRNFRLSRIRAAHHTGAHFSPPADFHLRDYLHGSLGRFTGARLWDIRLRVAAALVPYFTERPWHASQLLTLHPDGSAEVTLRLNNLIDIHRRVLACGAHLEILAPPELRTAITTEVEKLAAIYRLPPPPPPRSRRQPPLPPGLRPPAKIPPGKSQEGQPLSHPPRYPRRRHEPFSPSTRRRRDFLPQLRLTSLVGIHVPL